MSSPSLDVSRRRGRIPHQTPWLTEHPGARARTSRLRPILAWTVTLGLSAALLVPVGAAAQVVLASSQSDAAVTQSLVVLNPGRSWGDPHEGRRARIDQAAQLYFSGVAPVVVITGPDRIQRSAREQLETLGVPAADIVAFPTGRDTVGSLAVLATVMRDLGWSSATVITDPVNAARTQATARAYGIDAHVAPAAGAEPLTSEAVGREVVALLRHYAWTQFTLPQILGTNTSY